MSKKTELSLGFCKYVAYKNVLPKVGSREKGEESSAWSLCSGHPLSAAVPPRG